ncbi:acyl-CoA Delta(11) desaturase-like [Nylanderia fulva]|uniref:acyl-CoA Delta(11) desaturase-like n=1 Tax=Nylanderia fulva TaxID=613905 RepID=UPI0010FB38FC|nr:acyl-CoA Delta(11) desaturase-like [Nylanderia fulva]
MKFEKIVNDEVLVKKPHKIEWQIIWANVIIVIYIHFTALYGIYLTIFYPIKLWTFIWFFAVGIFSNIGSTAGVHRLWSHRSYKAKWPMKLILMIFQTISYQGHIYGWVRDHRVHHKFTDTDADPYNARKGFFFSHIGWILVHKHPDVISKGAMIDLSDLKQDCLVVFQRKYDGHSLFCRSKFNKCLFYHRSISPTENAVVSFISCGEGWHNYHHVFPWDYKAAELGNYKLNIATAFIDFFAYLGLAYDLKTASAKIVKKRALRNSEIN